MSSRPTFEMVSEPSPMKLGINGLGRIGKLSLWHQVERRYFAELVMTIGREAGTSLEDIALFIEKDSVYVYRGNYYYGCTLPSQAINRTKDGYNLFKLVDGESILIPIKE